VSAEVSKALVLAGAQLREIRAEQRTLEDLRPPERGEAVKVPVSLCGPYVIARHEFPANLKSVRLIIMVVVLALVVVGGHTASAADSDSEAEARLFRSGSGSTRRLHRPGTTLRSSGLRFLR
jgi:hypothetical protein